MAYLNPRYNGKVGVYRTDEIERFGSIPQNEFFTGSLGGMVFIPVNKALVAAPVLSADVSKYTAPLVQTYDDQRTNIEYTSPLMNVGLSITGVDYDTFDFAELNPTINGSSWPTSAGVYQYVNDSPALTYVNVSSGGQFFTFSGIELKNALSVSPASGRQIISFYVKPNSSFTFAPYSSIPFNNQAKAFFYNFTTTENMSYVGSYSTAGIVFRNYAGSLL